MFENAGGFSTTLYSKYQIAIKKVKLPEIEPSKRLNCQQLSHQKG